MELRLKKNQTTDVCNVMRCKGVPGGQYLGIGYLCQKHADALPEDRSAVTLVGTPPKFGNDPNTQAIAHPDHWKDELKEEASELSGALEDVRAFVVETDDDVAFATEELGHIKTQWNALEEKRTDITKPMNKALKEVNALFKPAQKLLKEMETAWKRKLSDLRLRRQEEQTRLLAEAREADTPEEIHDAMIKASDSVMDTPDGVSFRDNWRFRVIDRDAVPDEFWTLDGDKIAQVVKALKDQTNIPGVEVYNDPIVAARAR